MTADDPVDATPDGARAQAGIDLRAACAWVAFGITVFVGSITMDRLEQQGINKYTVPGLLPGLLGIAIIILGSVLGVRSWRLGGRDAPGFVVAPGLVRRLAWVIGLVLVFTVGLVGHGIPFWIASTLYVTASILVLQAPQRAAAGQPRPTLREIAFALAVGLGSGVIITYVFQELFLVRLP